MGLTLADRYCQRPVVAVNSGGPLETVAGDAAPPGTQTGILCEPTVEAFAAVRGWPAEMHACMHAYWTDWPFHRPHAQAMARIVTNKGAGSAMGKAGRRRVETLFSFQACAAQLDHLVRGLGPAASQ